MILSLRLKNWKTHSNTLLTFGKGSNLLVGPMGSGKSSIVEGICFALYGTLPSVKNRRVKTPELISSFPEKEERAEVEIKFTLSSKGKGGEESGESGKVYSVTRSVSSSGKSEAVFRESEKAIDSQSERVTEAVERVLGVDYELFSRVVYSEQNRIDAFLSLQKGERKRQLDELLGLDKLETARTNAVSLYNRLKSLLEDKRKGNFGDEASLESDLRDSEKLLAEAKGELELVKAESERLARECKEFSKNLAGLEEKERIAGALEREIAGIDARALSLEKQCEEAQKSLGKKFGDPISEKQKLEVERKRLVIAGEELQKLGLVEKALEERLKSLSERLAALKQTGSIKETEGSLESARKALEEKRNFAESKRKEINEVYSRKSVAEKRVSDAGKKLSEKKAMEIEAKKFEGIDEKLKKERRELDAQVKGVSFLEAQLKSARSAIESLGTTEGKCPVCGSELQHEKHELLVAERRKEERECFQKLDEGRRKIGELNSSILDLEENLQKAVAARGVLGGLAGVETELSESTRELENSNARILELQGALENLLRDEERFSEEEARLREELRRAREKGDLESEESGTRKSLESAAAKRLEFEKTYSKKLLEETEFDLRAVEKQIQANELFEAASSDRKILEAKKRELEEISFDKNELSEIRGGSSEKEKMLAGADARAGVLVKLVSEREKHCKILGKQLLDLTQASKSAGELQEGISQIQIFQNALVQTQSELRKDLVDSVNEEMQEQFKSVYPYGDFESIRLLASEDDYSLELLKSGEWVGVEALSGGERACAAIALRIAFATVLAPSLKWLVLDEPTHNLDSEAVKLLGRAVHEGIPQAVEQVFVITHEEALKEGATGKVFSVSRDKEGMGYSVVEEVSE